MYKVLMKQLDVVVSPPTFVWNPKDMNFSLAIFSSELLSSDFWYSDRQTDRRTDGKRRIRAHHALAQVGSKTTIYPKTALRFASLEVQHTLVLI